MRHYTRADAGLILDGARGDVALLHWLSRAMEALAGDLASEGAELPVIEGLASVSNDLEAQAQGKDVGYEPVEDALDYLNKLRCDDTCCFQLDGGDLLLVDTTEER